MVKFWKSSQEKLINTDTMLMYEGAGFLQIQKLASSKQPREGYFSITFFRFCVYFQESCL